MSCYDPYLKSVCIYYFNSIKVTETTYTFNFWIYFPEENERYVLWFGNEKFDFDKLFEVKEITDQISGYIAAVRNHIERIVPDEGKHYIDPLGRIDID